MAANSRRHHQLNPEMTAVRRQRYKENLKSADGFHTKDQIENIRKLQKDSCAYCGKNLSGGGEVDHKTPLSRGGDNYASNLALTCTPCNRDKHDKTEDEFVCWRLGLGLLVRDKPSKKL
jgi:5-methylcytosine-specific restriction endonuclease McrA